MNKQFEQLSKINVSKHVKQKNKFNYLSWTYAWVELQKICNSCSYKVKEFDCKPYIYDKNLGYMVFTSVTVDNITHEMWLPVIDGANKTMKDEKYSYKVKDIEWINRRPVQKKDENGKLLFVDKYVEAATMFDINNTLMRCLVKNIAMFGLGINIYAGEDLPIDISTIASYIDDSGVDKINFLENLNISLISQKQNTFDSIDSIPNNESWKNYITPIIKKMSQDEKTNK